jgi:hypothetical protein
MGRRLEVFESTMKTDEAATRERVLREPLERIEKRLEVRLAHECGAVSGVVQHGCDRRGVGGQRDPVHPYPVGTRVLAGDHRRARRHAHDRLRRRSFVPVPFRGQSVDDRRAGDSAAVAAERVVTLLVGCDEENLATHQ